MTSTPSRSLMMRATKTAAAAASLCLLLTIASVPTPTRAFVAPRPPAPTSTTQRQALFAPFDRTQRNANAAVTTATSDDAVPYVVERISETTIAPRDTRLFAAISNLCINVFFKEKLGAKPNDRMLPWQAINISSLKKLQTGDLRIRRERYRNCNEMFLVYEVRPAVGKEALKKPVLLDLDEVYNMPNNSNDNADSIDYVKGDLIAFVEITQKAYGLGDIDLSGTVRPILTNLAVAKHARKSGIGSELLRLCEDCVVNTWKMGEIVLEVEDYNDNALEFYRRRGYKVVYTDPASRRFTVDGLMLRKERCSRDIMCKTFDLKQRAQSGVINLSSFNIFQRLRETVGI